MQGPGDCLQTKAWWCSWIMSNQAAQKAVRVGAHGSEKLSLPTLPRSSSYNHVSLCAICLVAVTATIRWQH